MLVKSKLVSILATLGARELRQFEEYIVSPFFNKNQNVVRLFDALKPLWPAFPDDKLDVETVFAATLPEERFEEQKLRYVMTDLTKLLEEFLAFIEYEKNEIYKKHLLLDSYNDRNLDKYFSSTYDQARAQQEKMPLRDVSFFFHQHLLEENAYIHSSSGRPRNVSTSLQEAVNYLDLYYLSNKLRYSCAILNRKDLLQERYEDFMLEEIAQYLGRHDFEAVPAVSIYYHILMTFKAPDAGAKEVHYYQAKDELAEHAKRFTKAELKDMYVHILNYCIKRLNSGDQHFLDEMFELYNILLHEELIFDNNYLTPSDFKNIVTVGLRSQQVEWTENFIEHYRDRIQPEYRDNTYLYNLAFVYHYQGDYGRALKLLMSVEMTDIYYHLDSKVLLLRTYYELNDTEPYLSLIDAFTNYLKRNKQISDNQRQIYLNFVKIARKLMQIRLGSRFSPTEVRKQLVEMGPTAGLQWLHTKLDELEGRPLETA